MPASANRPAVRAPVEARAWSRGSDPSETMSCELLSVLMLAVLRLPAPVRLLPVLLEQVLLPLQTTMMILVYRW